VERIVRLAGEIDCATRPAVEAQLMQAAAESGAHLIADLHAVSFLDCAGLGGLIAVRLWARERGLSLRVARPSPQVRLLLDAVGPDVLSIVSDGQVTDDRAAGAPEDPPGVPEPDLTHFADSVDLPDEDLVGRLEVTSEELRVVDEELRAQQELIDSLLRERSADRLAGLRLVGALPVPVVETNRAGLMLTVNPAAAVLFRVDAARLRGKPVAVTIDTADRRALRSALARVASSGGTEYLSVRVLPRDGTPVAVSVALIGGTDPAAPAGPDGRGVSAPADPDAPAVRLVLAPQEADRAAPDSALLSALGSVSLLSAVDGDLRTSLARVAELTVAGIAPAVDVGLVVGSPAAPTMLVTTGELAQAADGEQFQASAGPSWDAYATRRPVTSPDLYEDERWPGLTATTPRRRTGVAALPIPASAGDSPTGVLTLYGTSGLAEPEVLRQATLFADAVSTLLRQHEAVEDLRQQERQLREALSSRAVIDQAKGILMAQYRISGEAAFQELVRRSQHANVKLREVARLLVAQASGETPVRRPAHPEDRSAQSAGS
jgi:anti-anti-sigma factor